MMTKIVHDRDTARNPPHFHPAADAFESVKCGLDLLVLQPAMFSAGDNGQSIADIQFAEQVDMELETGNFEFRGGWAVANVESLDSVSFTQAKSLNRTMVNVQQ